MRNMGIADAATDVPRVRNRPARHERASTAITAMGVVILRGIL
jgi:hypothetical protein